MIQIKHSGLGLVSLTYYRIIDKKVKKRIVKVENFVQAIYGLNGKSLTDFVVLSPKKWKVVKGFLNKTFEANVTEQKDLHKWTIPAKLLSNRIIIHDIINHLKVEKNRKTIILAEAKDHDTMMADQYTKMGINSLNISSIAPLLKKILDYKMITKTIAYDLTWGLNIRTCPYCNRMPIDTVRDKKGGILRPSLDHFYSQKNYPLMGLSFYNLIPSCTNCNTSIKKVRDFKVATHVHPYIEGFDTDACFSFNFTKVHKDISHPDNFTLEISKGTKIKADKAIRVFGNTLKDIGSIPTFKIDMIYQVHKDLLGELYVKSDENNPYYLTSIKDFLAQLGASKEEFYRFHFHNYYEDELMSMRPLSKFTKDIILERVPELR